MKDIVLEIIIAIIGGTAPGTLFHLFGIAAKPWARATLSMIPDLIGAIRRAQGLAGAPGAPNVTPLPPIVPLLALLFFLPSCGGSQKPTPEEQERALVCLVKVNTKLAGRTSCEAIVQSVASVIAEDNGCASLILHGLKCVPGQDGG